MAGKKTSLFPSAGSRITSTFSVAMVLFILGVICVMGVAARHVTEEIRENMGFTVLLSDIATDRDLDNLRSKLTSSPFTYEVVAHTAREAADDWKQETGEDVEDLLGVNPFQAELEVRVKPDRANTDSLRAIAAMIGTWEYVDEVELQADMIDSINSNISTIAVALSLVAAALLFISFVLINNTVRLTVYAKRFIIHTMKLVGATRAFIRRPIVIANAIQGVTASAIAILLIWLLWNYISTFDSMIEALVKPSELAWIGAVIVCTGIIMCTVAAWWSANRYISLSYDEMFS